MNFESLSFCSSSSVTLVSSDLARFPTVAPGGNAMKGLSKTASLIFSYRPVSYVRATGRLRTDLEILPIWVIASTLKLDDAI